MATNIFKRNGIWYFKMRKPGTNGAVLVQSLQVRNREVALAKAKALRRAVMEERWDRVFGVRAVSPLPTLGELLRVYEAHTADLEIEPRTAQECAAYLRRIVATATGGDPDQQSLSCLDGEAGARAVRAYKAARLAESAGGDTDDDEDDAESRTKRSVNSALRQARSVFTPRAIALYRDHGLRVPDVGPFKSEPGFSGGIKRDYHPPGDDVIQATFAALDGLRSDGELGRDMYRAICLAVGAGLRKSEVRRAERAWFVQRDGRPWLRSSMVTKNGAALDVPILPEWWHRLTSVLPENGERIIANPSQRLFRAIGKWMTGLGWQTQKKLHEFRAYVGCRVAEAYGIEAASLFLRHGEIGTTQRYYGRYLKLRSLDAVQIAPASPAPMLHYDI